MQRLKCLVCRVLAVILAFVAPAYAAPKEPEHFNVRFSPQVSLPGNPVMLVAEHVGPEDEAHYCFGWEMSTPSGVRSSQQSDCALPWEEYQRALAEEQACRDQVIVVPEGDETPECPETARPQYKWAWHFRAPNGPIEVTFRFLLSGKRSVLKTARLIVPTGE